MNQEPKPIKLNLRRRIDELENTLPLQSPERTLGYEAVRLANHHASIIVEMGQYEMESDEYQRYAVLEKSFRADVEHELRDVRESFTGISPYNEMYLDQYLNVQTPFTHFARLIDVAEKREEAPLTWKEWLTEHATNDELLNFLQFHNAIIEKQQTSPIVQEAMEAHRQKFTEATRTLRESGVVAGNLEGLDGIDLEVGDIFDMIMKERTGFYGPGIHTIHVQQAYFRGPHRLVEEFLENIPHIATHELVHAVLGEAYKRFDSPLAARWINEALTEELTRAINRKMGDFDNKDRTYLNERSLLHLVLSHGAEDNTLAYKLAIRGFTGSKEDRDEFGAYLDIVWGRKDVLGKLNQAIELEELSHLGFDEVSTRASQIRALDAIYQRLKTDPDTIFVQYEEAIELLPKIAAQE